MLNHLAKRAPPIPFVHKKVSLQGVAIDGSRDQSESAPAPTRAELSGQIHQAQSAKAPKNSAKEQKLTRFFDKTSDAEGSHFHHLPDAFPIPVEFHQIRQQAPASASNATHQAQAHTSPQPFRRGFLTHQTPLVIPIEAIIPQSDFTRAMDVNAYLGRTASTSTVGMPDAWTSTIRAMPTFTPATAAASRQQTSRSNPASVEASVSPTNRRAEVSPPHNPTISSTTATSVRKVTKVQPITHPSDCYRCGNHHDYPNELCTEELDISGRFCGEILSDDEYFYRVATKVHCGYMTHEAAEKRLQLPTHHLCHLCDGIVEPNVAHKCSLEGMESVLESIRAQGNAATIQNQQQQQKLFAPFTARAKISSAAATISSATAALSPRRSSRASKPSTRAFDSKQQTADSKQQAAEVSITSQLALIQQAQAQLQVLQERQLQVQAQAKVITGRRIREQLQAEMSTDLEERQQIKSSRPIRREKRSADNSEDERAEMPAALIHDKLFNFRAPKPTKDRNGYVISNFVDDDHESESAPDDDDDGDPDYEQTDERTPSPTHKVSTKVMRELAELRKFKQSITDLQAQRAPEPLVDHHGRALISHDINFRTLDPPPHGPWDDLNHLMTTFKDAYDIYRRRCGRGKFDSIWECYNPTAQANLVKRLGTKEIRSGSTVTTLERDASYLASLTDDGLLDLLCSEMGIEYAAETEAELRKLHLQGSHLVKSNWVTLQTQWERVLKRTTERGKILPKELSKIFIQCIEDKYVKKWLLAQESKTWTAAYDKILVAITDVHWVIGHSEAHKSEVKPPAPFKPTPKVHGTSGDVIQGGGHNIGDPPPPAAIGYFDPLKFKNKAGKFNVNPNLKRKLGDLNPEKTKCTRCDWIHNFDQSLCTSDKKSDNATPCTPLAADELAKRHKAKWELGILYTSIPIMGPTPANAASAASKAAAVLGGGGAK
jgi:hypothetical protein